MNKKEIIGNIIQFLMILITFGIMFLGGLKFLIISIVFFGLGGLFEWIIMRRFYGPKVKLIKKIPSTLKILNGILWVHAIVRFIKINGTTIYDFDRLGLLVMFVSYLVMLLYVGVTLLLFQIWGDYAFIIYLVPAGTNIVFFLDNRYRIKIH